MVRVADERDTVPDGQLDADDPAVVADVVVEGADRLGALAEVRSVEDGAVPQRVVGHDQAAVGQLGQHRLVVVHVVRLVGVDEDEVERAVQRGDRVEGAAEADLDAVGVRALLDEPASEGDGGLVDVTGDDSPAPREAGGHRQGRVPGEGADLQHAPGARHRHQHLQEPTLERPDHHPVLVLEVDLGLDREGQQVLGQRRRVPLGVLLDVLGDDRRHGSHRSLAAAASGDRRRSSADRCCCRAWPTAAIESW